jgi:hypothetical protein
MLESEAWRCLPHFAKMVVFRICIEHMHHAGTENGALKVTYADFEEFGVRRKSIRSAIAKAVEHGFIRITQPGRRSSGPNRWPAHYALTWLPLKDGSAATNAWKAWVRPPYTRNIEGSRQIAPRTTPSKTKIPTGQLAPGDGGKSPLA